MKISRVFGLAAPLLILGSLSGCSTGRSSTDVQAAAQVLADKDHAPAIAPYVAALTTLNAKCTQKPLDIDTDDVMVAQQTLKQSGHDETTLAVLQAMAKVASASKHGKQDCAAIARSFTTGLPSPAPS